MLIFLKKMQNIKNTIDYKPTYIYVVGLGLFVRAHVEFGWSPPCRADSGLILNLLLSGEFLFSATTNTCFVSIGI